MPVRLLEAFRARQPTHRSVELLQHLAPTVRAALSGRLVPGLWLARPFGDARRSRLALLTFVLIDPSARQRVVKRWLGRCFVPELLPALLRRLERLHLRY